MKKNKTRTRIVLKQSFTKCKNSNSKNLFKLSIKQTETNQQTTKYDKRHSIEAKKTRDKIQKEAKKKNKIGLHIEMPNR